jgi:hypothetical protein
MLNEELLGISSDSKNEIHEKDYRIYSDGYEYEIHHKTPKDLYRLQQLSIAYSYISAVRTIILNGNLRTYS